MQCYFDKKEVRTRQKYAQTRNDVLKKEHIHYSRKKGETEDGEISISNIE